MFINLIKRELRLRQLRKRFCKSVFYQGATVDETSVVGDFSVLFKNVNLLNSTLGAFSYIQAGSSVFNAQIGPFCSIAGDVTIGLASHPTHMVSTSPVFYDNEQPLPRFLTHERLFIQNLPRTTIGADVWIGQGAMVRSGVNIGTGAIIGAGAIVTKDIPAYTVAAGNPCKPIRQRFTEDVCQRLLATEWWVMTVSELERLAPLFADPESLLEAIELAKGEADA